MVNTKMNTMKKRRFAAVGIYTAMGLLVVIFICLSFFSLATRRADDGGAGMESTKKGAENTGLPAVADTQKPLETNKPDTAPVVTEKPKDTEAGVEVGGKPEEIEMVMPVNGTVVKDFSDKVATFSLTMNDYRVHTGIDIYAPVGTQVMATADGTVEKIYEDPFLGMCMLIDHGNDVKSFYCNLSADIPRGIETGVTVLSGEVIAGVGETMAVEIADTSHLHYEVWNAGVPVNPMEYIKNYDANASVNYDEE